MRQTALTSVHELAKRNKRVLFIGSDLGKGVLDAMKKEMPERFYMEGVSEANIVGMAAGLAMDGYMPYVNTIATFLTRRCFEQIAIDVCLHRLPVRLIGNGGGLVYAPLGPTHMATDDIAILRALPHMTIIAPADPLEMRRLMALTADWPDPLYVRVGRGGEPVVTPEGDAVAIGRARRLRPHGRVCFLTTGIAAFHALGAADRLAKHDIEAGVLHFPTVKPLDVESLTAVADDVDLLVSVEEHSRIGGFGSAVAEALVDAGLDARLLRCGLPDEFPMGYGSQAHLLAKSNLDAEGLARSVIENRRRG
jgi:transketolase